MGGGSMVIMNIYFTQKIEKFVLIYKVYYICRVIGSHASIMTITMQKEVQQSLGHVTTLNMLHQNNSCYNQHCCC